MKTGKLDEYAIPSAVLNGGPEDGIDGCDLRYPKPMDWIKAHAQRFHFTDEQIIQAAQRDFYVQGLVTPWVTGVYFIVKGGEIVYVGQSRNIAVRFEQHFWMRPDGLTWIEAPWRFLDSIEAYYIDRIRPQLNNNIPNGIVFREWMEGQSACAS